MHPQKELSDGGLARRRQPDNERDFVWGGGGEMELRSKGTGMVGHDGYANVTLWSASSPELV